jgi:hypothetical protein
MPRFLSAAGGDSGKFGIGLGEEVAWSPNFKRAAAYGRQREGDLGPYTILLDQAAMRFVGIDRGGTWRRMAMFCGHWVLRVGPGLRERRTRR